MQVERMQ